MARDATGRRVAALVPALGRCSDMVLAALLLTVIAPAAAVGATLDAATLADPGAVAGTCHAAVRDGAGVRTRQVTTDRAGLLRATLAARGDWDLAVFDAGSGRLVAASAAAGGRELAEGFVSDGQRLLVQACRRDGAAGVARVRVATLGSGPTASTDELLVTVRARTRSERNRLAALGLDQAEGATAGGIDVILRGPRDRERLRDAGLGFAARPGADLRASDVEALLRRRPGADHSTRSALPSGRGGYRRLADYDAELRALAAQHPGLVKLVELPHKSLLGRTILGVEIARDVNVAGGQPVFLLVGLHHAREWPAAEHAMEFAHELAEGYGRDGPITGLVDATRTIVVPVVNPDGFNLSRESPLDLGTIAAAGNLPAQINGLLPISDPLYLGAILADAGVTPLPGTGFTYKRRNCRVRDGQSPAPGECESLANRRLGVDPNRNYGGFWGGAGAGFDVEDDTYRGAEPFSEPEVRNVRELVSGHQVTTLITNHTFGNLILRPPGVAAVGDTPDEALYRALGDAMAAKNGYASQHGFELYDTTGTTEDWSYYATGGLGFTFEIGAREFHPPYPETVELYSGNREAYLVALGSTADAARHAVADGRAAPGTVLRARKQLESQTAPVLLDVAGTTGPPRTYRDVLDSTMTVGSTGRFTWHLNPSTRPAAAQPEAWTVTCEGPDGQVVARGELVIARGERRALDLCALKLSFGVDRRTLPRALQRGLRARARCSVTCAASATLSIDNATARRLGLAKRRSAERVVLARGDGRGEFRGRRPFTMRFTAAARRALRGARRLRARVSAVARAGTTDRRTVRRTLTLPR